MSLSEGAIRQLEPDLKFDDDRLLLGDNGGIEFMNNGVLTKTHWLRYASGMPGNGVSGGFVERLLCACDTLHAARFGLALHEDVVMAKRLHHTVFTKVHVRGPRRISSAILQDPRFPETPSGTVTVHKRLEPGPLHVLFPLERVEVMWSSKEKHKTVQIEELRTAKTGRMTENRYIHARWNTQLEAFDHFDGALRSYAADSYHARLNTDMRKFRGKAESYSKLFRIDGNIDINTWADLVVRFFDQNELVLEYLENIEDESETGSAHSQDQ